MDISRKILHVMSYHRRKMPKRQICFLDITGGTSIISIIEFLPKLPIDV